ncbi:uncharacterized protein LOC131881531 [Tigriopus californicus]|uniref:uncharacterized protein LOC131881531 n=1 Tax=Tigriopus californicus TaxID=6832 RepID=UPI0027D9E48A|nr:uncharacterized protein LOC131881531 [Tigriopus californicus]
MSKIVDDMLLQATNFEELLNCLQVVFNICFEEGITFSIDKLEVGKRVPFAGFIVYCLTPDPAKVEAISAFPSPKNLTGLGYALIQREKSGRPQLIQCGSCTLSPAQRNYAVVELELTAVWLQRLRENLAQYKFTVMWTPGKRHLIADALSRYPVFGPSHALDKELALCAAISINDPALRIIASNIDEEYRLLARALKAGGGLPPDLSGYAGIFGELRVEGDLILMGERLFVPHPARPTIIELLHTSHSGINKTCKLASQLYVWPTLRNDVRNRVASCPKCVAALPSQEAEPVAPEGASFPVEAVAVDLFDLKGSTFVVMVDRYSGFPFTARLSSTSTEAVWSTLMEWFYLVGFPTTIKTDNGPQFRGPFAALCVDAGIKHITSSPYHPASNGLAESGVKAVKTLLKKLGGNDNAKFRGALLEWRCTPRVDGFSPADAFHARRVRSRLPSARQESVFDRQGFADARSSYRDQMVKSARGRPLRPLVIGQHVHIQDVSEKSWSFGTGTIVEALPNGRSYRVQTDAGVFRRNRRHLRPASTPTHATFPPLATLYAPPSAPPCPLRSVRLKARRVSFRV